MASAASTKWKREYETGRKYNRNWEERFTWVTQAIDGSENAYCKVCFCALRPKTCLLASHEQSVRHTARARKAQPAKEEVTEDYLPESEFLGRAPMSDFSNLANLEAKDILEVAGAKILDSYTLWQLLEEKAKLNPDCSLMDTILTEVDGVLKELRGLFLNCMELREKGRPGRPSDPTVLLPRSLSMAIGLTYGRWKRKPLSEIDYETSLDLKFLLRDSKGLFRPKQEPDITIKTEIEDEDEDYQDENEEPTPRKRRRKIVRRRRRKATKEDEEDTDDDAGQEEVPEDSGASAAAGASLNSELPEAMNQKEQLELPELKKEPDAVDEALADVMDGVREEEQNEEGMGLNNEEAEEGEEDSKRKVAKKKKKTSVQLYGCKSCGKTYVKEVALLAHEKKCVNAEEKVKFKMERIEGGGFICGFAECMEAGMQFASKEDVEVHFAETHAQESQKVIPCHVCGEKFVLAAMRNSHMRKHHERSVPCDKCERRFYTERERDAHVARLHLVVGADGEIGLEGALVPCQKCGRLLHEYYVRQHEAKCSGLSVRHPEYKKVGDELICTVPGCTINYGFNSTYGLRLHFHTAHISEEERVFHCDYCDAKFAFNTTRNKHVKEIHLKIHGCQYCTKRFGSKEKLRQHIRTHTGEKPFSCDRCEYRSAKKYNLDEHKRVRHGEQSTGSYSCGVCGKLFTTSGRVRRHIVHMHQEGKARAAGGGAGGGPGTASARRSRGARVLQQQQAQVVQQQQQVPQVQMVVTQTAREQDLAVEFLSASELHVQHQEEAPWQ